MPLRGKHARAYSCERLTVLFGGVAAFQNATLGSLQKFFLHHDEVKIKRAMNCARDEDETNRFFEDFQKNGNIIQQVVFSGFSDKRSDKRLMIVFRRCFSQGAAVNFIEFYCRRVHREKHLCTPFFRYRKTTIVRKCYPVKILFGSARKLAPSNLFLNCFFITPANNKGKNKS